MLNTTVFITENIFTLKTKLDTKKLLRELLKLQDSQIKQFKMFEDDLKALQSGPFHAGVVFLEDAKQSHRNKEDEIELLKDARKEFIRAYGNIQGKQKKNAFDLHTLGFIQSYIGITWFLLKSPIDAKKHLKSSLESLSAAKKLFNQDIRNLENEINCLEKSVQFHQQKIDSSFISASLDFFFPNDNIVGKKKQIPKYKQLVSDYKIACNNSEKYAIELKNIRKQISLKIESEQTLLTEATNTGAKNMKEQDIDGSNKLLHKGISSIEIFKNTTATIVEKAQSSIKQVQQNEKTEQIIDTVIDSTVGKARAIVGRKLGGAIGEQKMKDKTAGKLIKSINNVLGILKKDENE